MDCPGIIGSLDILWFYSNVVTSFPPRSEQSAHACSEDEPVKGEATKPIHHFEEQESSSADNLVQECAELDEEMGEFVMLAEELKKKKSGSTSNDTSSGSSSGRRRRGRRSCNKKRLTKNIRKFDCNLGFDYYGNYMDFWLFDDEEEMTSIICGQHYTDHVTGSSQYQCMNLKMPSLDDNMAMKEHLRSWAQAVACTVR